MSLEDDLLKQRLARIRRDRGAGLSRPTAGGSSSPTRVPDILAEYGAKTAEELVPEVRVRIAGRLMTLRHMGKAGFAHLQQNGERLQIYVKKDAVGERRFRALQAGRYRRHHRRGRLSVPHAHRRTEHPRREARVPLARRCSRCRRSGTAWRTWRRATASAIWT